MQLFGGEGGGDGGKGGGFGGSGDGDGTSGDGGGRGGGDGGGGCRRVPLRAEVRALLADSVERYSRSLLADASRGDAAGKALSDDGWGYPVASCVAPLRSGLLPAVSDSAPVGITSI
mmetsp:Transcript_23095/g.61920  ORF Transcript_23095/g.61920 Transcript_23095/m.61920 type:complete len:117 (+) Transcript_23095:1017-1367(+)